MNIELTLREACMLAAAIEEIVAELRTHPQTGRMDGFYSAIIIDAWNALHDKIDSALDASSLFDPIKIIEKTDFQAIVDGAALTAEELAILNFPAINLSQEIREIVEEDEKGKVKKEPHGDLAKEFLEQTSSKDDFEAWLKPGYNPNAFKQTPHTTS